MSSFALCKISTTLTLVLAPWQTLESVCLQHQLAFLQNIKYNLLNIAALPPYLIVSCTNTHDINPLAASHAFF